MNRAARSHPAEAELIRKCRSFRHVSLDLATLQAAERCILDWLGCTLAGSPMKVVQGVATALSVELAHGPALEFARGTMTSIGNAALINGTAAHAAELDDIYSPALYHPGAPVIAAAAATAQATRSSGMQFIKAVVAGYEISNAIGAAVNPSHYRYWHTTGTVGTLGAAVASAALLELTDEQLGWAIGHAASMAAGLQQAFRSDGMTKPLHAGRAAESGTLAARLAMADVTGAQGMLSGPAGLGNAMSSDVDWGAALGNLFVDYTISRITFKRFPACGHTFPSIDATLELLEQHAIDPSRLREIVVATYQKAIDVAGNPRPRTAFEARFSIPYAVAVVLAGGDLTRPVAYSQHLEDPAVRRLMNRVQLTTSVSCDQRFPELRGAEVMLVLESGERLLSSVITRRGDPANPLSDNELAQKFSAMVADVTETSRVPELVAWVRALPESGRGALDKLAEHVLAVRNAGDMKSE